MEELPKYFYVFVRQDIPLADQLCQVAHACLAAGKRFRHPNHTNLVLLSVPDLPALKEVEDRCVKHQVGYFINFEPDDDMQETSIATEPVAGERRRLFSQYRLWKYPEINSAAA